MKFRHNLGVRLSLVSGHVTFVGPDWRPLHERFHTEALSKGCECDQSTIRTRTLQPAVAGANAVTPLNEHVAIRAALIRMLQRNGVDDFNHDNMPNLEVLAAECGFRIDKGMALAVWHELEQEAREEQEQQEQQEQQDSAADAGSFEEHGAAADADADADTVAPSATVEAGAAGTPAGQSDKAQEGKKPQAEAPARRTTRRTVE